MDLMEFRQLGHSGFKVPVLSYGTGTFGGKGEMFKAWGGSDVAEATRLIDIRRRGRGDSRGGHQGPA